MDSMPEQPLLLVVLGGTGDLAETKLYPALFELYLRGMLPRQFTIFGLSRKRWNDTRFREYVKVSVNGRLQTKNAEKLTLFSSHFTYIEGDFSTAEAYARIERHIKIEETRMGHTNKLVYLAVPPQHYAGIFKELEKTSLFTSREETGMAGEWSRLLVEKPFGKDLETAKALERDLKKLFREEQIYRIDHYLAKDAIENILALRFANSIVSDSWNGEHIESISIRLLEKKDVSNRGAFYDDIGTLRDVGQNHMLQIFALLTMDRPSGMHEKGGASIREARAKALQNLSEQLTKVPCDSFLRAQYRGFGETMGVRQNTDTETYFAINVTPKEGDWKDVHFEFEAGKALHTTQSEAVLVFKPIETCICGAESTPHEHRNVLKIEFAPMQRITLTLWAKKPGFTYELVERSFVLARESALQNHSPEAYERVLYDCIEGDQTRFVSGAEVEAAWSFITPILTAFKTAPLHMYEAGSEGPRVSNESAE